MYISPIRVAVHDVKHITVGDTRQLNSSEDGAIFWVRDIIVEAHDGGTLTLTVFSNHGADELAVISKENI